MTITIKPGDDVDMENLGLTEEEREALEEDAAEESTQAAEAKAKNDAVMADDDGEGDGEGEGKGEGADGDKAADKTDAAADAGDKTDAAADTKAAEGEGETKPAEQQAAPQPQRQAFPNWQAPEDAEAKLKEIADKRSELAEQFDNGELTAKQLFEARDNLDTQARDIERAVDRANMSRDIVVSNWTDGTVPAFMEANTHYRDNPALTAALDAEVRRLQEEASANGGNPFDPSILTKADDAISAAMRAAFGGGKPEDEPPPAGGKKADEAGQKTGETGGKKPNLPPSIANLPATDIADTAAGGSRFSRLEQLAENDPQAYEDYLLKMSDADREAYERHTH